jgi:hypothetical protein
MQTWQAGKRTAVPMSVVLDIDNYPLLGQVSACVSPTGPQNLSSIGGTHATSSGNSIWGLPCALIVLYCTALYKLREVRQLRCYGI